MSTSTVIYKCRMCGKEHAGPTGASTRVQMHLIECIFQVSAKTNSNHIGRYSTHSCGNGQTGFSDLIGIREESS